MILDTRPDAERFHAIPIDRERMQNIEQMRNIVTETDHGALGSGNVVAGIVRRLCLDGVAGGPAGLLIHRRGVRLGMDWNGRGV